MFSPIPNKTPSCSEQHTLFSKISCFRTGIPAHLASFQRRIAHNPNATGMLAGGSGWYRAIQVIRVRTLLNPSINHRSA